jgi:HEAT repeat protein
MSQTSLNHMDSNTQNEIFNKTIKKLFHGKIMERVSAAIELGTIKDGRATNLLIKALRSENDDIVINRIIEALGEIKDSKATLPIIDFLKVEIEKPDDEQNKSRMFLIIESLMKIGDKRALTHLGILLNSCHSDIRKLTEEAFECIDLNWRENIKKSVK